MPYTVYYFSQRVLEEIESWPVDVLADYVRLVELLIEFGPDVRMPHSRAMGDGLFELRPRGREGIGRALYTVAAYFLTRRWQVWRRRRLVKRAGELYSEVPFGAVR